MVAALLLLGPGLLLRTGEARAESIAIKPTQVHLSKDTPSALLTVRNDGKTPTRFQLSAFTWAQDERGEMSLAPTKDVVFFPTFVVLPPGAEKKVRVGTSVEFADVEKTYRLFFDELPPAETEAVPGGVAVLTRFGVPVFLQPRKPAAKATLEASPGKGALAVVVRNAGNSYVLPSKVSVRFQAKDGKTERERSLDSWYILAGGLRRYEIVPSAEECAGASSAVVEATVAGETLSATVDATSVCPRVR